ncbi:MAG: putative Transcriptional regulator, LuxR family [Nitrospira sp.]|jgi:DNA-binding CsgD family transcriptional regulator|nr:putative Transcriptional regulator, LuxR family [Nitrospira sp.]
MIFRGPESLQYPSRKEFQHLGEIMHQVREVQHRAHLSQLASAVGSLIPHRFAANGAFHMKKRELQIGHSTYGEEHTHLYATQGYVTDPAIQLLQQTHIGTVSSEDCLDMPIPREVITLKLDAGIKTCLTVGVRGVLGICTYYAFSNFDQKLLHKLRTMMQILAPHFHLAYLRATSSTEEHLPPRDMPVLTGREEEIMRWVAEGKTNWEISIILHVSLNTVKFHLKNVYQKLGGVENRWAAVAQWQSNTAGIIVPSPRRHQTVSAPPLEPGTPQRQSAASSHTARSG